MKIIKKYNQYIKESLLDKLKGPSYDEIIRDLSVDDLLRICFINLDDKGVEYALNKGASKKSYNKLVEMKEWFLDMIVGMEKVKINKYPKIVYWVKGDDVLFKHELQNNILLADYDKIWWYIQDRYEYSYNDVELFIKNIVKEHLNLKDFILSIKYYRY